MSHGNGTHGGGNTNTIIKALWETKPLKPEQTADLPPSSDQTEENKKSAIKNRLALLYGDNTFKATFKLTCGSDEKAITSWFKPAEQALLKHLDAKPIEKESAATILVDVVTFFTVDFIKDIAALLFYPITYFLGNSPVATDDKTKEQQNAEWWDLTMDETYLRISLYTTIFALIALTVSLAWPLSIVMLASLFLAIVWNFVDALGAIRLAQADAQAGEDLSAAIGYFSGIQLLIGGTLYYAATSIATLITEGVTGLWAGTGSLAGLGTATLVGTCLAGYGFAACMFFSMFIELKKASNCTTRIKGLEWCLKTYQEVGTNGDSQDLQDKIAICKQLIASEKIARYEHRVSAGIWFSCGVTMTASAIVAIHVAVISASLASFGVLPLLVAVAGLLVALGRWLNNHVKEKAPLVLEETTPDNSNDETTPLVNSMSS